MDISKTARLKKDIRDAMLDVGKYAMHRKNLIHQVWDMLVEVVREAADDEAIRYELEETFMPYTYEEYSKAFLHVFYEIYEYCNDDFREMFIKDKKGAPVVNEAEYEKLVNQIKGLDKLIAMYVRANDDDAKIGKLEMKRQGLIQKLLKG